LTSSNRAYPLTLRDDGNLVLVARGHAVRATGTNGRGGEGLEMHKDGNCVLYAADKPIWHTDTTGANDVGLLRQDDRNLVLYGYDGPACLLDDSNRRRAAAPARGGARPRGRRGRRGGTRTGARTRTGSRAAPPPEPRTYTVEPGDTLWAISERFYATAANTKRSLMLAPSPTPT
jgi:nucleoid-associated protein YgaU